MSPPARTSRMRPAGLFCTHQVNPLLTYFARGCPGVASRISQSDLVSPAWDGRPQGAGFADMPESSRNTRTARSLFHGFGEPSIPFCRSTANCPEAPRYER